MSTQSVIHISDPQVQTTQRRGYVDNSGGIQFVAFAALVEGEVFILNG